MGDWLSFIIFAGIFYFMMRYGCGAHMIHGHHSKQNDNKMHFDPVCGMKVDEDKGYGKMQDGTLYRFCSKNCLNKFEDDPDKFINLSENKEMQS